MNIHQNARLTPKGRALLVRRILAGETPPAAAAIGAARAIRTRGLAGKVKVVGFDASPTLRDELRNGVIGALVVRDPFKIGYLGIETIMRKLSGETPQKIIHSPARVITAVDPLGTRKFKSCSTPT